ncbi:hypothetical protein ABZ547_20860 [Streptomyces sparsogenes]|uniref:hypothetical protein n=1 Tax=Streptomyces sparsogenes TaxID=67365 RepID=UPI0033D288B2
MAHQKPRAQHHRDQHGLPPNGPQIDRRSVAPGPQGSEHRDPKPLLPLLLLPLLPLLSLLLPWRLLRSSPVHSKPPLPHIIEISSALHRLR